MGRGGRGIVAVVEEEDEGEKGRGSGAKGMREVGGGEVTHVS